MKNRIDIKNFILFIEENYPVNRWQVETIHFWPILRIRLYFYLIDKIETAKSPVDAKEWGHKKYSFYEKNMILLKKILKKTFYIFYFYKWFICLPKKRNVFVGADSHRVNYKGKRYNRYFDVFVEKFDLLQESLFFEYGEIDIKNHYNKEIIWQYNTALKGFILKSSFFSKKKKTKIEFEEYDTFINFLNSDPLTTEFARLNSVYSISKYLNNVFVPKVHFFTLVLKKINPDKIAFLCYYNQEIMPLVVAANKLNIKTVEMQHGPQSDVHLAYGSWSNVPQEGYDILPRNYYCWDSDTARVVESWIKKSDLYSYEVIGNPWVEYWKTKDNIYPYKNYILYTLQPHPFTVSKLFPPILIDFIKNHNYCWFIRLHPRQLEQKKIIENFLNENEILHLVNIENATIDPLPQLLINCRIHITNFSGSAIEADFFNVFSIIINEIGVMFFSNLIEKNKAIYLDLESKDFDFQLSNLIEMPKLGF